MRRSILRLILIVVVVFSLLFMSGCGSSGNTINYISDNQFRTGTNGVTMEFVQNSPPESMIEDAEVSVGVKLHNDGAYNVQNGYLVVSYDKDYLTLFNTGQKSFNLEGKNKYNKAGEEKSIFFDGKTSVLEVESQRHDVPIVASICYQYNATLLDLLCFDTPDLPNKEKGKTICSYKSDYSYSGQGAPVSISNVKLTLSYSEVTQKFKPIIDFEISHTASGFSSDKGLVVNYDNYRSACTSSGSSSFDNLNLVKFEASISDEILSCNKEEGTVTLRDGKANVRCTGNYIEAGYLPYQAPLKIDLLYGYMTTTSTTMQVIRS
jgi:hypothetical protein